MDKATRDMIENNPTAKGLYGETLMRNMISLSNNVSFQTYIV